MSDAPRLNLTIDRLVLKGFGPEEGKLAAAGFESELRRQLAVAAEGFGGSRHIASLNVARGQENGPGAVGARAAQNLIAGLRR
ncbi:MAG TPA: hypothetical protein VGC16_04100 [Rhizomicrobium sp.]